MPDTETSRGRLLEATIDYVSAHGVADLSLRALAAAIGTSHRMLIYHFGSKQGLLIEVIRAVEEQQRRTLADFHVDPSLSPTEVGRRMWSHLADAALWPNERLFFEIYGQALQARPHTAGFLDDIVESWLEPAAALRRQQGVPAERARPQARLDLAVTRGLLLDLLATGDRAGADAAIEQYIGLFEAWSARPPATAPEQTEDPLVSPTVTAVGRTVPVARILLISGSLRHGSTNSAVLRTARATAPEGVTAVLYEGLGELPPFNPDDDIVPLPAPVAELRAQIRHVDGILFSIPEYAGGLPGTLKNLLDWTIGDDQVGSIYEKPVAWINASVRTAADAHESLRKVLGYAKARIVEDACIHIPVATRLIDDDLIGDPAARDAIRGALTRLALASVSIATDP